MSCKIHNNTGRDMSSLEGQITSFYPYVQKKLGFNRPASIELVSDPENAKDTFGKTAYYSPSENAISVYVDGRHIKDILRSISHELVHHAQNCRGEFDNDMETGEGYAQTNPHLRKMEAEAYLMGNGFLFRDYEDQLKKENRKMNLRESISKVVKRILSEGLELVHEEKCPKCEKSKGDCECPKNEEVVEEEAKDKKPDDDGDGVPDWADKKPGKADHEDKDEKLNEAYWPTKEKNVALNKELMKRWCK